MCYEDDAGEDDGIFIRPDLTRVRQENTCPNAKYWTFDCGHNSDGHTHGGVVVGSEDYWDPRSPTRWLLTHWNTAKSVFLTPITNEV